MNIQASSESFASICLKLNKVDEDISSNPWAVADVSEFLKYSCPECEFQTKVLDQFGYHAVSNHSKSSALFNPVLSKVALSELITRSEEILPNIDQADINQFIPEVKQEDEVNFNETLKAVRIEKVQEIAALVEQNPKLIQPVSDEFKEESEDPKINKLTDEHEEVMEETIGESDTILLDPENAYVIGECLQDEKLPDDFEVDMIDPLLNSLMCSKTDLAEDHKLGVFETLDVKTTPQTNKQAKRKIVKGSMTLSCEYCNFVGSNELDKANHHWLEHNEKKPDLIKCEHCDMVFKTDMSIKAHYSKEHQEEFKFTCSKCPNRTSKWENHYYHHYWKHNKERKLVQCDKCGKEFKRNALLKEHIQNKHEKENLNICEHCGYSTYSLSQFRYHMKTNHGGVRQKKCPYCDKRCPGKQKLEIHIDKKHPDSEDKNFTCAFCGKGFIYANSLGHHKYWCKHQPYIQQSKKRHEEYRKRKISSNQNRIWKRRLRNVKCDYCDVAFEKRYEISEHYKINHPGQPILIKGYQKYNCAVCEEVFFLAKNRKKHMEQCHPEMKDQPEVFHCQPCNKTFKTNSSYIGHIKQHHKPVNCDICMKQMSCEYTLRQHRVRVHGIEDGAFFCPICPKSKVVFFSDRLLKMHMKNKHSE